jgi:hypothetical protein
MPFEFVAKNGLISRANVEVTGSISASNAIYTLGGPSRINGSLFVSSSLDTSGSVRLGNVNDTIQFNRRFAEKEFYINFPGTANEKADLTFSGSMFGKLQVEVVGGYYGDNSVGSLIKEYQFGGITTTYVHEARVSEVSETIAAHIALSDITWDASSERWKIQVVHRTTSQNHYVIKVRVSAAHFEGTIEALRTATLGTIYTTDSTVFPPETFSFPSIVHFDEGVAVTGSSRFSGSVDIDSSTLRVAQGTANDIYFSGTSFPAITFRSASNAFASLVSVPSL